MSVRGLSDSYTSHGSQVGIIALATNGAPLQFLRTEEDVAGTIEATYQRWDESVPSDHGIEWEARGDISPEPPLCFHETVPALLLVDTMPNHAYTDMIRSRDAKAEKDGYDSGTDELQPNCIRLSVVHVSLSRSYSYIDELGSTCTRYRRAPVLTLGFMNSMCGSVALQVIPKSFLAF